MRVAYVFVCNSILFYQWVIEHIVCGESLVWSMKQASVDHQIWSLFEIDRISPFI